MHQHHTLMNIIHARMHKCQKTYMYKRLNTQVLGDIQEAVWACRLQDWLEPLRFHLLTVYVHVHVQYRAKKTLSSCGAVSFRLRWLVRLRYERSSLCVRSLRTCTAALRKQRNSARPIMRRSHYYCTVLRSVHVTPWEDEERDQEFWRTDRISTAAWGSNE